MVAKSDQKSNSNITLFIISVIMTLYLLASDAPGDSISKAASVCMLLLLITAIISGKAKDLPRTAITPVVISVSAYMVIYTVSLFYASTGQFALTVFSYYLGGASVFFLTVLLVNKNADNSRRLISILAFAIAIAGIFSIDAASFRGLTAVLGAVLAPLSGGDAIQLGGFEAGTRMTSIIGNPNVFGSLAALGTLASAYLFLSGYSKKERNISCGLLIANAVSFLYCFSLGSMISMFFAIIGLIALAGKEERGRVVYVVLATVIAAFLSIFAGFSGMGKTGAIALLPLLSLLIFGFVLAFMLRYMESFTAKAAALGGKKILIILVIIVLLISAAIGAAVTIPDSFTFEAGNGALKRAVSLEPGDYQLAVNLTESAGDSVLLIESQSYDQASTHTSTILYKGSPEGAVSFTVPPDSNICFINVTAPEGSVVDGISVSDTDGHPVKTIHPDYLLLPTFMANRLQGIFVNENAAQRFVFFEDGLKIAAKSPIIGHGPGAFESKVLEVQNYYYETRSPHNHYIQTLDETGIIGLLVFLAILLTCILALAKKVRTAQNRILYIILFAMLIMIVIHTAVEVTFIYGIYDMAVFIIFGLISSQYGQKEAVVLSKKKGIATVPGIAVHSVLAFCVLLLVINLGQFAAVKMVTNASKGSATEFLDTLKLGTVLDFTNDVSYKTSFIAGYSPDLPEGYSELAEKYAEDLQRHNSFGTLTNVVNYYLKTGNLEKALETLNSRQALMRYDAEAWNETFDLYRDLAAKASGSEEDLQLIKKYASAAYEQLEAYLETSPLDIKLSDENQEFVEEIRR